MPTRWESRERLAARVVRAAGGHRAAGLDRDPAADRGWARRPAGGGHDGHARVAAVRRGDGALRPVGPRARPRRVLDRGVAGIRDPARALVRDVVAAGLVGAAVTLQALCCVGVARMPTALARLHYTMPATLAALLAAAGLLVREGLSQTSGRALMLAALFTLSGPPLAHATARAIRQRS